MNRDPDTIRLKFPLWQYLTQPLFSPSFKSLNPLRFQKLYYREYLEAAWARSMVTEADEILTSLEFLEDCLARSCWDIDAELDTEFINFLERCWLMRYGTANRHFDASENRLDEEESY
ncbi:MAG TPA: hypothetical protein V6C65_38160 [Allocoleopsis sp.]